MKIKWVFFAILTAFFVLAIDSNAVAVNTRGIDAVLKKSVIDERDKKVIDDFVKEAVRDIQLTLLSNLKNFK